MVVTVSGVDTGFRKGGGGVSGLLVTTKMCCICAHVRNVFSPLFEVWGSPKR